jgi:hypothetical protein
LIVARWLGRCGFGYQFDYFDLLDNLLAPVVGDIAQACVVCCCCPQGHHSHIFIYLFICSTNIAKKAQSDSLSHQVQLFENLG